MKSITVEVVVESNLETVWELWTTPLHVIEWNYASIDWECPYVENNVVVGGKFLFRMSAKDNTKSFDFTGVYTDVLPHELLTYTADDGRKMEVIFTKTDNGVKVKETFELENINPEEMQRNGWQAILNNFKQYAETHTSL